MAKLPWCVRHREGWCMANDQKKKPKEDADDVLTVCRHFVWLPGGIERRLPTCKDCLMEIAKRHYEASNHGA